VRQGGEALAREPEELAKCGRGYVSAVADMMIANSLQNPSQNIPYWAYRDEAEQDLKRCGLTLYGTLVLAVDEVERRNPGVSMEHLKW
jgi:hypothetical protein